MRIIYPIPKELEEMCEKAMDYLAESDEIESNLQFTKIKLKENASEETKRQYKIFMETRKKIMKIVRDYENENDWL